jgi:hypothetical protein
VQFLETWQHTLGLPGFTGATLAVGVVSGLLLSRFTQGGSSIAPPNLNRNEPGGEPDPVVETQGSVKLTMAAPAAKAAKEQRRAPRRSGRHVHVFVTSPGSSEDPRQGIVLDRSAGGLKILLGYEYQPGETLQVLPGGASQLTPWVAVVVRTCQKSGEDWEVGVQFQTVPPYATMVLFG